MLPRSFHEQSLVLLVIGDVSGKLPALRREPLLGGIEVVLADHRHGIGAVLNPIGAHVEHENPIVPTIGDEEPLMDPIHGELRGS